MKQSSLIAIFESKRKAEEFDPSSIYQRLALQNKNTKQNQQKKVFEIISKWT